MKEKKKNKKTHGDRYADFEEAKFVHWLKAGSFHIAYYSVLKLKWLCQYTKWFFNN